MNEAMWNTVCDNWNISSSCSKSRSGNLEFTAFMKTSQMDIEGNCFLFLIKYGIFPESKNLINIYKKLTIIICFNYFIDSQVPLYCPHKINDTINKPFKSICDAKCDNPSVSEIITESKIPNNQVWGIYQFWLLFLLLVLSWSGMAVVVSVGDAICFGMLGNIFEQKIFLNIFFIFISNYLGDKPHLYGNQRLWGAVGWGIFSVLTGWLVDLFSEGETMKNYSVAFYMMLVLILLDIMVSGKLKVSLLLFPKISLISFLNNRHNLKKIIVNLLFFIIFSTHKTNYHPIYARTLVVFLARFV